MDKEQIRKAISESVVKGEGIESFEDFPVLRLTGLTLDQIRKLKKRDTALLPIAPKTALDAYYCEPNCPNCGKEFGAKICGYTMRQVIGHFDFCPWCGQRLNWEGKGNEIQKQ